MEFKKEEFIYTSKHSLIFNFIWIPCIACFPILSFIPFVVMNFKRFDFHIVLAEIFFILLFLFFNWAEGYTILFSNSYVVLSRTLFLNKKIYIPKKKINRITLFEEFSYRITLYKLRLIVEGKTQEYRVIDLSKKSIEKINTMEITPGDSQENLDIVQTKTVSLRTVLLMISIACLIFALVLSVKNMIG